MLVVEWIGSLLQELCNCWYVTAPYNYNVMHNLKESYLFQCSPPRNAHQLYSSKGNAWTWHIEYSSCIYYFNMKRLS